MPYKALVITEHKQKTPLTIQDFEPVPPAEGEILIENVAVAQNPVDWKQIDRDMGIPSLPWVNGGDVAGTVVEVGPGVKEFAVGDRVISFLERKTARHGAYQTHSLANVQRTAKLPEFYSFEEGSTIPLAYVTAAAGLIDALKLKIPPLDGAIPAPATGEPLLVWGGSSSVGAFVIQIAKAAGYTVLTTASKSNHEYVRALGADLVFDYHDEDVVSQIKKAAGDKLSLVYDTISENGTTALCVKAITKTPARINTILSAPPDTSPSPDIQIFMSGAVRAQQEPETVGKPTYGFLAESVNRKWLQPNKVKVIPGGLRGVNVGFELGRAHKVSGEKLVYRIADTEW